MAILKPYSEELTKELDRFTPIEQWNLLAHDHAQLHRGFHMTFHCRCDECTSRRESKLRFETVS